MKKQAIIISFIAIFLTMTANIGELRCQENSNMANEQYQSKNMGRMAQGVGEDGLQDDKNAGVELLGWVIQRHLFYEYQQIDQRELEERVERSR
jgi:hypothetical protein